MLGSPEIIAVMVTGLTLLVLGYALLWAWGMMRALRVQLYRNHAMGVAIVAMGFSLLDVESVLVDFSILVVPAIFLTLFASFILIFYFVDTAILSARRADPLLRDTARWSKVRTPVWVAILVSVSLAIATSFAGYSGYGGIFIIPFILVGVSGAVALPRAAGRSRDVTFNRHLRWFGAFTIFAVGWFFAWLVVAQISGGGLNPTTLLSYGLSDAQSYLALTLSLLLLSIAGYCLYKSARSLAPLNRIPLET